MSELNKSSGGGIGPRGGRGSGRGPRRARPGTGSPSEGGTDIITADGKEVAELSEKVVFINRSSKVVKGGRRFSFSALVVVGDKRGRVGIGLGKSGEVSDAIRKGGEVARSCLEPISIKETTIPHEVIAEYCGAQVLLRPASAGTGVIAGKTVRAVLDSVGIRDVLSKSLGSKNPANVVKATLSALRQLRQREDIFRARGLAVESADKAASAAPAATS